jgi:hypothetical protein
LKISIYFNIPSRIGPYAYIIVVIEGALLRGTELSPEKIYPSCITTTAPGMPRPWKRSIRRSYQSPFIPIDEVDVEIIEKSRQCPIEIFATKQEKLVVVRR